jgi:hypothetical protein
VTRIESLPVSRASDSKSIALSFSSETLGFFLKVRVFVCREDVCVLEVIPTQFSTDRRDGSLPHADSMATRKSQARENPRL